jgi:hypothetical protein
MATLTTWEADRGGFFQGTPTPGQAIGQAIDWLIEKFRKLPNVPKPEAYKEHWRTWPEGKPIAITDAWVSGMICDGRLPSREQVTYSGNYEDRAEALSMSGSHVIVEMLDTDRKTRHRCVFSGNVLVATREGWEASQNRIGLKPTG